MEEKQSNEAELIDIYIKRLVKCTTTLTDRYSKLIARTDPAPSEAQSFLQEATLRFAELSLKRAKAQEIFENSKNAYQLEYDQAYLEIRENQDKTCADAERMARQCTKKEKGIMIENQKIMFYFKDLMGAVNELINSTKKLLYDWQQQFDNIQHG